MTIVQRRSNRSAKHAGHRAEHQRRQQPDGDHAAEGGALGGAAGAPARRRRSTVASRPSQSPKEAAPSTSQSRRNGRMRSTERIAAEPDGSALAAGGAPTVAGATRRRLAVFWLSMAVPPRAGPSLGTPGGTL